jgi:glycerol-3-phosphate acyltransferase PlsY
LLLLLACAVSYFAGSLPFGLWIGLYWKKVDIRTLGSNNIGTTNVLRVLGPGPGFAVFVLDTVKGLAGIALARLLWPEIPMPALIFVGFCAILGHTFSLFLGFKGGKGVATSFGVLIGLNGGVALVTFVLWALLVALTRYVSVASIVAGICIPIAAYILMAHDPGRPWMVGLGIILVVLVLVKHRTNIARLRAGTEAKIGQRVQLPATDGGKDAK